MNSEHVHSFLNDGLLYMNTLGYFRSYEEEDEDLRADEYEGVSSSLLAEDFTIKKDGKELEGIIGKLDSRPVYVDEFKVYCMTALTTDDLATPFFLDEKFKKFGDKAIIIEGRNLTSFFERLKARVANDESIFAIDSSLKSTGLIHYVERDESHYKLTPFNKFSSYQWQREFRIAFESPTKKGELELRLGSLKDIVEVVDTTELLSTRLRLK